eukprot:scaffold245811_cov30-Tisochrysis_lutea.AAC.3
MPHAHGHLLSSKIGIYVMANWPSSCPTITYLHGVPDRIAPTNRPFRVHYAVASLSTTYSCK